MQKRRYILLAMSIVLMLLGVRYVIFLNARHHLLCEELKLGMSADDVLRVLHQNGDFHVNKINRSGGDIQLRVKFTDPRGQALYSFFNLDFSHYKYNRAFTEGILDFDSGKNLICYLGQITPSGTEIPEP